MGFRITTWNVNGIRNPFSYEPWRGKRTFEAMFDILEADIVVFQETKIQRKDLRDDMVLVPGWDCYFSLPRIKKGYSGVAIYTRNATCAPIRAEEGLTGVLCPPNSSTPFRDLPEDQQIGGYPTMEQLSRLELDAATLDSEGRCVILEFPAFVLIGVYCPANRDETRDSFRHGFLDLFDARIRNLVAMGKRVFVTGDINISREQIDAAHAAEAIRKGATTEDEFVSAPARRLFNQLLAGGKVVGPRDEDREQPVLHDICRSFHPDRRGMYTCWEQRINARPGNYGSRIDYVLCSLDIREWSCDSNIQEGLMGSDHCPVYAVLKDLVPHQGAMANIRDLMSPSGVFRNGERQGEYTSKLLLPLSGRLIPEFDKRRSIKDMFTRKPSTPAVTPNETPTTFTAEQPPQPPQGTVRKRVERPDPPPAVKRTKSTLASSPAAPITGQKSLKGFFKPKSGPSPRPPLNSPQEPKNNLPSQPHLQPQSPSRGTDAGPDTVIDPIASQEGWSNLFAKKQPPTCEEHREECIRLKVKKPGINCGRAFWICPRPLGPSGNKEKGSEWRCSTFIWASDWNP
ncbi:DNA-(apurinic or apyrimidinic site) lyase APN2 [Aspergillus melleus]|uniref:DNA-(apurinic or apyrimidinic site) lyase APN2 n=1 Tax=Aspergillus melleus TaxID=138277 RepID=UPI001E8CD2EE|nr:Class II abasic (AP) endonuclease [Aspergillus melleus]KAH8428989.1 Class II abasic (AP) endonuclease [Aspergillus melleus]